MLRHHWDKKTKEEIGSIDAPINRNWKEDEDENRKYVITGTSTLDKPLPVEENEINVRIDEGWVVKSDFRNIDFYNKETQEKILIKDIGVEPGEDLTELVPFKNCKWSVNKFIYDVEIVKKEKINSLDKSCNTEILNGFDSSALGEKHRYSSDHEAQINIMGYVMSGLPVEYVCTDSDGIKDKKIHTAEQMRNVFLEGSIYKDTLRTKFHELEKQVNSSECDTELKINNINW